MTTDRAEYAAGLDEELKERIITDLRLKCVIEVKCKRKWVQVAWCAHPELTSVLRKIKALFGLTNKNTYRVIHVER